MRVNARGSSFAKDQKPDREQPRAERFRKAHRAGQKVRGTVVEWRGQGLAWVEIDGYGLLAQLSPDCALGRERTFLVVSLSPNIELKELPDKPEGLNLVI